VVRRDATECPDRLPVVAPQESRCPRKSEIFGLREIFDFSRRRPLSAPGGVFASGASGGQKVAARQPATAGSPDRLSRRRGADMSLSDRERPRAFEESAVLSRARPSHLFKNTHKERPRAFPAAVSKYSSVRTWDRLPKIGREDQVGRFHLTRWFVPLKSITNLKPTSGSARQVRG